MNPEPDPRRAVPPVHELLESPVVMDWVVRWGRDPVKSALRAASDQVRTALSGAGADSATSAIRERVLAVAHGALQSEGRSSLRRVLNGTGVILHTNLGRAPLSPAAASAVQEIVAGFSNLEYDVAVGERGSRHVHCASLVAELTGSEAALIVNNNAAAVALAVNELAAGRDVVVSRGELVEIGGSFRLPDVVERSGGRLRAVGTTNRTRLEDYRRAVTPDTGMILKVHPSNYRIEGFVDSVELEALAALGREAGVPTVHDLGSGFLHAANAARVGIEEPGPAASVEAGADLVTWSGDKLLGGPQAGIVHGSNDLIDRLRANPLARAFRVDKMTLAALEATLQDYRDPERALERIPVLRMIGESADSVAARTATALANASRDVCRVAEVREMTSVVGGGSLPGKELPSCGLAVTGHGPQRLDAACRSGQPPLVGRIERDTFLIDFRTLAPGEEDMAMQVLANAIETAATCPEDESGEGGRG